MSLREVAGKKLKLGQYKKTVGEFYGTPKEVWGFQTAADPRSPEDIARAFLKANAELFELEPGLAGLEVRNVIHSLGADHVIFSQVHNGLQVHRGYVTVHVGRSGHVFLSKNRSVPARLLPETFVSRVSKADALQKARRALPKRGGHLDLNDSKRIWFPYRKSLLPAWTFRLVRRKPRQDWIVYVNAKTGHVLSRYDNLSSVKTARALVFDPSPVTALGDHTELLTEKNEVRRPPLDAYREVSLLGLKGGGFLSGENVSTSPTGKRRIKRPNHDFVLRSHQHGFEEVMAYFHIDSSLRYLEKLGYSGPHAIFKNAVRVNVNGTPEDNSWYSPSEKMLTFGTGEIDDAEDAETILHELGHAIQDAICHDFGQSPEAAAMGEGFGDYWAASFFESKKPERYRTSVMTWDGLLLGLESSLKPPSLRRLDGRKTYLDFDQKGDEHDNGEIWSATLWDVRKELGHETADRVILESHFQLDGFTTFARGARAILDADRNLESGRHIAALTRVFKRRKIGPL